MRCAVCKTARYCGADCAKLMYPEHKALCKFVVPAVVVDEPIKREPNRQLQLSVFVDALDRAHRLVPAEKVVDTGKKKKGKEAVAISRLMKLNDALLLEDEASESRRRLLVSVGSTDIRAVPHQDLLAQMSAAGFPPALALRMHLMGTSARQVVALVVAIEVALCKSGMLLMHGGENLATFYIARGRVKTTKPLLQMTVEPDAGTTMTQKIGQSGECFAFMGVAQRTFDPSIVPNLEAAVRRDFEAEQAESDARLRRTEWHRAHFGLTLPITVRNTNPQFRAQVDALFNRCVFFAPTVGEFEPTLHAHRLCKGIPDWFEVDQIYSGGQMEQMQVSEQTQGEARDLACKALAAMFGNDAVGPMMAAAIGSVEK